MQVIALDEKNINPIKHPGLFNTAGILQPMPAKFWQETTRDQRMLFGHHNAVYAFPTLEAIELIKTLIAGREEQAIEIGSGSGAFALALGIRATDSHQQAEPHYRAIYTAMQQPTISYGAHVMKMDAMDAVRRLKPRIVFAAWVTHKFDPRRPELKGNEVGVDEVKLLARIDEYIFFGNTKNHSHKPLWEHLEKHAAAYEVNLYSNQEGEPDFLFSRASGGKDFVLHIKKVKQ